MPLTLLPSLRRRARDDQGPIYLISTSGFPNFGDEFITRAWLDWLAEHHPKREVWLDCIEPGRAAHLFRDTHPRLKTTNTLWQTAHMCGSDDVVETSALMERVVTELGSPRTDLGLRDLRQMASLHLLGGGYMNTLWGRNLGVITAMVAVRRRFGVPIFATGQGLLPHVETSRPWMRDQLAMLDYVESRDREGAEAFQIRLGADDAFLAFSNERPIYADPDDLPDKMVLIQGDMFAADDEDEFIRVIESFVSAAPPRSVGFAEGIPPDDRRFADSHLETGAEFFPFMKIWDEGFPAKPGQAWLTSRFHFHLLAAAAGADGAVVNVRPGYYDIKHGLLQALGTGWTTLGSGDDLQIARATQSDFPARAREISREKAALARKLYPVEPPDAVFRFFRRG